LNSIRGGTGATQTIRQKREQGGERAFGRKAAKLPSAGKEARKTSGKGLRGTKKKIGTDNLVKENKKTFTFRK